jgi:hypothetical protein
MKRTANQTRTGGANDTKSGHDINVPVESMNFSDRFAYELHRVIAERMRREPDVVVRHALENLETWARRSGKPHGAEGLWREILHRPPDEAIEAFLDISEVGQVLRSSSVFAGLLPQEQRLKILREINERNGSSRRE